MEDYSCSNILRGPKAPISGTGRAPVVESLRKQRRTCKTNYSGSDVRCSHARFRDVQGLNDCFKTAATAAVATCARDLPTANPLLLHTNEGIVTWQFVFSVNKM